MAYDTPKLCCGSETGPSETRWPRPVPPAAAGSQQYDLRGPQVEPEASFWTVCPCRMPCVIRMEDLVRITDDERSECFFPRYPTDPGVLADEIAELNELASMRDDPGALAHPYPGNPLPSGSPGPAEPMVGNRRRLAISPFLQLRPQPLGAVFNRERVEDEPVIRTGRELARWFESETPGLGHRHALNELIRLANFSPPRQALVWMALDVAIYSALLAAWHYKWYTDRPDVRYRPRPFEYDHRVSVLFNRVVNDTGSGDGERRVQPDPSPGTPRHPAYPSGHSTVGGAGSEILSFFFPDYTAELDMLADNAGMARLWAGIHWRSDHEQGVKLGRCVAQMVIRDLQRGCICPPDVCSMPVRCAPPPTYEALVECSDRLKECCRLQGGSDPSPTGSPEREAGGGKGGKRAEGGGGGKGKKGGGRVSSAALREQAQGPQEGAAPSGSPADQRAQAQGPQQGARPAGSSSAQREQAKGPQEGAK